jgi:hypothetical protein
VTERIPAPGDQEPEEQPPDEPIEEPGEEPEDSWDPNRGMHGRDYRASVPPEWDDE